VIACRLKRIPQSFEQAGAEVLDVRRFAMHDCSRVNDLATKRLANALVTEAHAEQGNDPAELAYHFQ